MPGLEELGWSAFFSAQWNEDACRGCVPARIVEEYREEFRLAQAADGALLRATLAGRLRFETETVGREHAAVGDWVAARPLPEGRAVIQQRLARRTLLVRKAAGEATEAQVLAANVDTVLLVMGLDGDFNLRRMERYLSLVWDSGAVPVVVLNKRDLSSEPDERRAETEELSPGVAVHAVSALNGDGVEALEPYLGPGRTTAMLGSSGAGKSTLLNRLAGGELQQVRAVRAGDDRGRHTTTSRRLIRLPGGGLLVDTPGMRELQLWDADGVERTFEDIEALAAQCRFRDCRHEREPGCAVREAVRDGRLAATRVESFSKLSRELRYLAGRQDRQAQLQEKRKWKSIHRAMREFYKRR